MPCALVCVCVLATISKKKPAQHKSAAAVESCGGPSGVTPCMQRGHSCAIWIWISRVAGYGVDNNMLQLTQCNQRKFVAGPAAGPTGAAVAFHHVHTGTTGTSVIDIVKRLRQAHYLGTPCCAYPGGADLTRP
ncbi:hypothetical protein Pelo_15278 [Pelomyxa schiedti]|nr:hypothetical protein Pelo_15278 [Pelomyxa schiedti]